MIKPVSIEMMILYTLGVKLDVPLVVRCVAVVLKPSLLLRTVHGTDIHNVDDGLARLSFFR